jgi:penicillin-binding protein 1A
MSKAKGGKSKKKDVNSAQFWIQLIWLSVLSLIIFTGVVFLFISKVLIPDTSELENPKYDLATRIISADNQEIGKAFRYNREWLQFEEINPYIIDALVSTEDERYFDHSGIDARGTVRAVVFLGSRGGASTITQQLAKLFFTERSSFIVKRVWQKLKEWVIAVEFEKRYTKEEIIAMYLNKNDFIYQSIGIATAAKTYFGKDQKDLDVHESAILVGMLKNPVLFNPKINPEYAAKRKNVVMRQMVRNNKLSLEEYEELAKRPIELKNFRRSVYYDGPAPYFRAELIKSVKKILNDPKYSKPDGTKYDIYTDGLQIMTTIDSRIQDHAEKTMREHMASLQKKYFTVWYGRDPWKHNGSAVASLEEIKTRSNALSRDIRGSSRFKEMRKAYLGKVISEIYAAIPEARLSYDVDIFRLFNAEKDGTFLKAGVKKGQFSSKQAEAYQDILDSKFWPDLKKQWTALREASDKAFKQKVKMKVYDYETGNEKTVRMTPLDSIKYHQQMLQIGSLVLDAKTGEVKAWVGGVNHKYFQYDHVTSNRQVGSTFKPFVYATAIIDQAMSPCTKMQDIRTCIPAGDASFNLQSTWCPENSNEEYSGEWMDLRTALKKSTNTISVQLMKEIGNVNRVKNLVGNLGIDEDKIPGYPSICLGTPGLSVMDMAGAYTAFANNGTYSKPMFITRIIDKDGKVIYTSVPEQKKAINPGYNHVIVDLLKSVAEPIARKFKSQVAGKTGTTDDYRDGWFVGFTPELVISTWVGGEKEFVRFSNISDGQGGVMAMPMFVNLLKRIETDTELEYNVNATFEVPEKEIIELDCSKYDAIIQQDEKNREKNNAESDEFDEEF